MTSRESFDVAVIGGGLVGAAVAFGLRSLGPKLAMLDEGDIAHRAARGNFGLIWVQGKGAGLAPYGTWTQRSAREWPRLAGDLLRETGIDVALAQPGGIHVCLTSEELARRVAALEVLQAQPGFRRYAVEVLDRAALASRLPGLGTDVAGGTYCPLDGHCNPLKLLHALHAATAHAGSVCRAGHAVVYDIQSDRAIRAIQIGGTLSFASDRDTRLDVGLIRIESRRRRPIMPNSTAVCGEGHESSPRTEIVGRREQRSRLTARGHRVGECLCYGREAIAARPAEAECR